jgi:hypothetical protein
MAIIDFRISATPPNSLPSFDPRSGAGLTFHVDSTSNHLWIGLSTTGTETWGRFLSDDDILTADEEAEVGQFTVSPPILTTSNDEPTFPPETTPEVGKLHIHIAYKPESQYSVYIGLRNSKWSVYDILPSGSGSA